MHQTFLFSIITSLPWLTAVVLVLLLKVKSIWVPRLSVLSSFLLYGAILWFTFQQNDIFKFTLDWFSIGKRDFHAGFLIDSSSKAMLCLVGLIGSLVQLFSLSYMGKDPNINRYYLFLQLFVGSMIGLLVADQIWLFYGFWELVGASSYLIIGFWNHKDSAIKAAKKAFLINRIGDLALLIGLFLLSQHFQTDHFSGMKVGQFGPIGIGLGLILVLGASGKSAQFPLMSWLPDAMEGPTPASALIHAATMVTAGVYLALRIFPISGEETHLVFGAVGAISFLSAGLFALFQTDIKKTLAYSTISQIGLMWMGMGSSASLFHLLSHGIFKAGLFLATGAIIHYLHEQDKKHEIDAQSLSNLGGLWHKIPSVAIFYSLFAIGLIGLPLSTGFYSKENIAGYLFELRNQSSYEWAYNGLLLVLILGILLSTVYMTRQVLLIFAGKSRTTIVLEKTSIDWLQTLVLFILGLGSLWIWLDFNPLHVSKNWLNDFIPNYFEVPSYWLILSVGLWLIGGWISYLTREKIPNQAIGFWVGFWPTITKTGVGFGQFVQQKIDQNIDRIIHGWVRLQVILAHLISWIDRWIVDGLFVKGSIKISYLWGSVLSKWQSGKVQHYWTWIAITFGLFILYYIL